MRVYAKNFHVMEPGEDYTWGVLGSNRDPNGDLRVDGVRRTLEELVPDLELVFRPHVYAHLAVLPANEVETEKFLIRCAKWKSHTYMGENPFVCKDNENIDNKPKRRNSGP